MSWKPWIALAGLLFATNRLEAGGNVTGTINSAGYITPGSEQDLFFAPGDATRSQVKVSVVAGFSASASVLSAQYRFVARLLDSDGNPVSLRNLDGSATLTVVFPQFPVSLAAGTGAAHSETLALSLADGVQLDRYSPYRVEVSLQYLAGGTWIAEGPVRTTSSRRFFHFTNQTSGDLAYNAISEILSVVWKRTSAIDAASEEHHWLEAEIVYRLHRYDNFEAVLAPGSPVPSDTIPVRFAFAVRTGHGASIPAAVDGGVFPQSVPSFVSGAVRTPWASGVQVVRVRFHPNTQLPSGTEPDFRAVASITHVETHSGGGDVYASGNTVESGNATVLHFTGRLDWGSITTSLRDFSNDPTVGLIRRVRDVSVSLQNLLMTVPGLATSFTVDPLVQVALDDTGMARVLSGNGQVALTAVERTLHGIRYRVPGPIHLGPGGADASVVLQLPAGMGVGKPGFSLQSRLTSRLTAFNSTFEPLGINSFPVAADNRVVLDTRPLFFAAPDLKWNADSGELQFTPSGVDYVRRDAFAALAAATDLPESQTSKPSNERYYEFVTQTAGPFIVRVGPDGRTAFTARFGILPGQFVSHFPLGITTAWSIAQLVLQDDLPMGVSSGLVPINPITVAYEQGCPDGGCAGQAAEVACDLPQLFFTPDGGLVGEGTAAASAGSLNSLRWGRNPGREVMAHEVGPFQKAAFAISGHVLLAGALPPVDIVNGPGVLLESGATISPAATPSGVRMIRPGTTDYANGVGQYAGLNLNRAVETDPASVYGIARLGDAELSANFPLSSRVKYYARRSGVSGLHEASTGGFLRTLNIYRYPFEFKSYGLSFLSNENVDSETQCEIKLPAPVNDRFTFDRLTFTCVGAPDKSTIAEGQGQRTFQYWSARIDAQGVEFAPRDRAASACDASQQRFLALGSVAYGQGVSDPLAGTLYLSPEGDIITPADSERPEGVSFYLGAGSTVAVAGLDNTTHLTGNFYHLTLGKAYFNHPEPGDRTSIHGWLNLFGGLKLPFYGSTPVHLTTLGAKDVDGPFYINGGWTEGGISASDPTGDPTQRGLPPEVLPDNSGRTAWRVYREGTAYPPYAHGEFLDVVDLSFPLLWLSALHEFTGAEIVDRSALFIVETTRELHRLSASDIAIEFGTAYEGLPRIRLTSSKIDMVFDSLDLSALQPDLDLGQVVADSTGVSLAGDVQSGFTSLRSIAGEKLSAQLRALTDELVAGVAPGLRTAMYEACPGGDCQTRIDTAFALLHHTLLEAGGATANRLRPQLASQLGTAAASLRSLFDPDAGLFPLDPYGSQLRLATVIREILVRGTSSYILPEPAAFLGALVEAGLTEQLGEEINKTRDVLLHVADRLTELQTRYASDSADLYLEMRALFAEPAAVAELNELLDRAKDDLLVEARRPHWVEENVTGPGDAFERELASNVGNRLASSEFYARLHRTLEYHLRSVEEEGVSAVDSVLALLQRMINRAGRLALRGADHWFWNQMLGDYERVAGVANAEGYVITSGDEVRRLRLSAKAGMHFPSGNDFEGALRFEINALDSEGAPSCASASPLNATESILEFSTAESWDTSTHLHTSSTSQSFDLQLKATFDRADSISGFGGGFSCTKELTLGPVKVTKVAGACMFGPVENYFAGSIEGKLANDAGVQVGGGLFVGKTCDMDPLTLINSDLASALGAHRSFTGFYVYAEGWVPVVSSGCLLNLSIGLGLGAFLDLSSSTPVIGGRFLGGAKGELLCTLAASGTLDMTLAGGSEFIYIGNCGLKCRLGWCPFCVEFTKTIGLTYHGSTGETEFH